MRSSRKLSGMANSPLGLRGEHTKRIAYVNIKLHTYAKRDKLEGRAPVPSQSLVTSDGRKAGPFEHFNRGGEPGGHWKHGGECCGACSSVSLECSEWRPVKVDNSARRF